jgi:hypothetical protein
MSSHPVLAAFPPFVVSHNHIVSVYMTNSKATYRVETFTEDNNFSTVIIHLIGNSISCSAFAVWKWRLRSTGGKLILEIRLRFWRLAIRHAAASI